MLDREAQDGASELKLTEEILDEVTSSPSSLTADISKEYVKEFLDEVVLIEISESLIERL